MSGLVKFWLASTTIFEFIGLYKVFVAQEKLSAVQPMYSLISGATHHQDKYGFLFMAGLLAVVRIAQLLNYKSKGAWAVTAAVHVFEAAWFTLVIWFLNPKNRDSRYSADVLNDQRTQGVAIYAIVLFNALLFTLCWVFTPSSSKAASKGKRE